MKSADCGRGSFRKQRTVDLCQAVCVKRYMEPSLASERRMPCLWCCLFQKLIKVWMCKYIQGCASVFTAQGSSVLYSKAG